MGHLQDSEAHVQMGVLGVAWAWARMEEDPGTWAKAWMGTCSWDWLGAGVARAWSPSSQGG